MPLKMCIPDNAELWPLTLAKIHDDLSYAILGFFQMICNRMFESKFCWPNDT